MKAHVYVKKVILVTTALGSPALTTATTGGAASKDDVPVRMDMKGKAVHLEAVSTTVTTMVSV